MTPVKQPPGVPAHQPPSPTPSQNPGPVWGPGAGKGADKAPRCLEEVGEVGRSEAGVWLQHPRVDSASMWGWHGEGDTAAATPHPGQRSDVTGVRGGQGSVGTSSGAPGQGWSERSSAMRGGLLSANVSTSSPRTRRTAWEDPGVCIAVSLRSAGAVTAAPPVPAGRAC